MKGKAKSKKKKQMRPALSAVDKGIYILFITIGLLGIFLLIICFEYIQSYIAFRNPEVIAYRSSAASLWTIPFVLYVGISVLAYGISALEQKKPIFGRNDIEYGKYPLAQDCFPRFGKQHREAYVSPNNKSVQKGLAILWVSILLFTLCLTPLGLFGRTSLSEDNSVVSYNILNQLSEKQYTDAEYSHLTIRSMYVFSYRGSSHWEFQIKLKMIDGKTFQFSNLDFTSRSGSSIDASLKKMIEIKALFLVDKVTIEGANDVYRVIDSLGMNDEQSRALLDLFNVR